MTRNRRHDIVKSSKYKTSLCSFFLEQDGCSFGDRCAFAHGEEELRSEEENLRLRESRDMEEGHADVGQDCNSSMKRVSSLHSTDRGIDNVANETPDSDGGKTRYNLSRESELWFVKQSTPLNFSNQENKTKVGVTTSDNSSLKGIKPPPKITKGNSSKHSRTNLSGCTNKVRHGGFSCPMPPVTQYTSNGSGILYNLPSIGGTPGQFIQPTPGIVLLPFTGVALPYVTSFGTAMGASTRSVFSGTGKQPTESHATGPFSSADVITTETSSAVGLDSDAFDTFRVFSDSRNCASHVYPQCKNHTKSSMEPLLPSAERLENTTEASSLRQNTPWPGMSSAELTQAFVDDLGGSDNEYHIDLVDQCHLANFPVEADEILNLNPLFDQHALMECLGFNAECVGAKGGEEIFNETREQNTALTDCGSYGSPVENAPQLVAHSISDAEQAPISTNACCEGEKNIDRCKPAACSGDTLECSLKCQSSVPDDFSKADSSGVSCLNIENGKKISCNNHSDNENPYNESELQRPCLRSMCSVDERARRRPFLTSNHFHSSCAASGKCVLLSCLDNQIVIDVESRNGFTAPAWEATSGT